MTLFASYATPVAVFGGGLLFVVLALVLHADGFHRASSFMFGILTGIGLLILALVAVGRL